MHEDWQTGKPLVRIFDSIEASIRKEGWHAVGVGAEKDSSAFLYTTGLTELGHPELFVSGVDPRTSHQLVASVAEKIKAGERMSTDVFYDFVLEGYDVQFIKMNVEAVEEHCNFTNAFYANRETVEFLQMVIPDSRRRFPWDEGYDLKGQIIYGEPGVVVA